MKTIEIMRLEAGFSLYTDARTMKYRTERGISMNNPSEIDQKTFMYRAIGPCGCRKDNPVGSDALHSRQYSQDGAGR